MKEENHHNEIHKAEEVETISQSEILKNGAIDAIKTIFDPEIPVNIYELALIYKVINIFRRRFFYVRSQHSESMGNKLCYALGR